MVVQYSDYRGLNALKSQHVGTRHGLLAVILRDTLKGMLQEEKCAGLQVPLGSGLRRRSNWFRCTFKDWLTHVLGHSNQ